MLHSSFRVQKCGGLEGSAIVAKCGEADKRMGDASTPGWAVDLKPRTRRATLEGEGRSKADVFLEQNLELTAFFEVSNSFNTSFDTKMTGVYEISVCFEYVGKKYHL